MGKGDLCSSAANVTRLDVSRPANMLRDVNSLHGTMYDVNIKSEYR